MSSNLSKLIIALSPITTGDKAMAYQVPTATNPATNSDTTKEHTPAPLDTLPSEGFIRVKPLAERLGIHSQTLRRWWKADKFPRPQNRNGILLFSNADVKQWISDQPKIIG